LGAFIDSQNSSFKAFLRDLLDANKISDPRLVQEAETLIADQANQLFNYGGELLRVASAGRGRQGGGDALQGATEAAGRMWELLWRPEAYPGAQTWETRFPRSAQRGGIRGTIRAVANNLVGHYAQRLRKARVSVATLQASQISDPDNPIEVAAGASNDPGEWEEWRKAIISELVKDLHHELARNQGGKHSAGRVRNLRWAVAIADKQMAVPYQWRSMPEVMAEIPDLQGVRRGGLQQALKNLIDDARMRVVARMGSEKEQAVARRLQTRGRRAGGRTRAEAVFLPCPFLAERSSPPGGLTLLSFREFMEGLLLPDKPVRAGMTRINPFPATQRKVKRLFPARPGTANSGSPLAPPLASPRPAARPVPSPLQAAWDGFAGYF
jgi:hypothetical protein